MCTHRNLSARLQRSRWTEMRVPRGSPSVYPACSLGGSGVPTLSRLTSVPSHQGVRAPKFSRGYLERAPRTHDTTPKDSSKS